MTDAIALKHCIVMRGQALPLVLGLISVGSIAWIALYNVGQMASARIRLTHVADAVAYSGAVAQARSLNMLAYINRAHVAHQVAMAHLVTLSSWAQYGQTQSQQRATRNPPSTLIAGLFGASVGKAYAQARPTEDIGSALAHAFQQHDDVVHQILQQASASVVDSLKDSRQQMMSLALRANYPEYGSEVGRPEDGPLQIALLSDGLPGYIRSYPGHQAGRLRHMVEHAAQRYDFLQRRNQTRRHNSIVNDHCPTKRHELRRRGNTRLETDGRWSARDTLSFHALRSNRWIGCYYREYAMGWGDNSPQSKKNPHASDQPPHGFAQQDFWRWVHEHTTWDLSSGRSNPMAKAYAAFSAMHWASRGLPNYYELNDDMAYRPLRFAIQLRHSAGRPVMQGAENARVTPIGRYAYHGLAADEFVTVNSAAQAYFAPPSQNDGNNELASLFRPYWQARLSPILPGDVTRAQP
ncbi:hypothetical protein [Bordetella muralis]|uniref:hypothetical protein n=1 Tax=Bordetella muralis TaxID=1649130 RepID=UPI0039F0AAA3